DHRRARAIVICAGARRDGIDVRADDDNATPGAGLARGYVGGGHLARAAVDQQVRLERTKTQLGAQSSPVLLRDPDRGNRRWSVQRADKSTRFTIVDHGADGPGRRHIVELVAETNLAAADERDIAPQIPRVQILLSTKTRVHELRLNVS